MSDETSGTPGVPSTPPGWGPPPDGPGGYDVLPAYTAPEPKRSKPGAIVAIGVGIAAAMVATVFAVTSLSGNEGSSTPEAAVEGLFAAVANEDLVGVLESLPPGERSAMLPGIRGLASELQRLRLLSDDLDLSGVSGIDFEVDGLELQSEPLGPGVTAVRITAGTITASFDPTSLPVGDNLRSLLAIGEVDIDELEPDVTTEDLTTDDAPLVVIEEEGGWHVSLFYSIAEAARRESGKPVPAYGAGVAPQGADSPEAVVEDLLAAATRLDARAAIALLAPDEMRALHDYAPLFLDEIEAERDEMLADGDFEITVDELELDSRRNGDTAQVFIRSFAISGVVDGEAGSASFDGDCFTYDDGYGGEESCISDADDLDVDLSDVELGVTVVERGGEWYLSPVRTGFDLMLASLGLLEPDDFDGEDSTFGQLIDTFVFGAFMGMSGFESEEWSTTYDETFEYESDGSWDEYDEGEEYDDGVEFETGEKQACHAPLEALPHDFSEEEYDEAWLEVEECFAGG